jgi:branched-chain amino acid transport system permease protein
VLPEHTIGLATDISIMSLLALSAYLLLIVGRVSFGQQAFFGLGAYTAGIASAIAQWPLVLSLTAGVVVGALASAALAWPTMKLSGLSYAVATLAFAEMARITLLGWHWQVERDGTVVGPAGGEGLRDIRWLFENEVSPAAYLLLCLALLATVLLLLAAWERTRFGLALRMTGHDDTLATALGLPVARLRLLAATAAGAIAALGGGLYAHRTTYIEPSLFDPMLGVHAVGYALIGGLGTASGPLVGVLFDIGLLDAARIFEGWRMVVFGGVVALFLRWRPRGLLDEALVHRLRLRRRAAALPARLEVVR